MKLLRVDFISILKLTLDRRSVSCPIQQNDKSLQLCPLLQHMYLENADCSVVNLIDSVAFPYRMHESSEQGWDGSNLKGNEQLNTDTSSFILIL